MYKSKISNVLILAILTLISIWPFIVNGFFPLVNSDAGAYVQYSIIDSTPIDRSVFYSYFIRFTSFQSNICFTLFAQSLIGSSLILILFQQYFKGKKLFLWTFFAAIGLSILAPYTWINSQLNPDIFMGYFGLTLLILLFYKVDKWIRIYLYLLITLYASIHNSILLFSIIFLILGLLYSLFKKKKQHLFLLIFMFISSGCVYIFSSYLNQKKHQIFAPNPSSHVFLMSRLAEMGIMKQVLDKECQNHQYSLCQSYQKFEGRQWSFMWESGYPHSDGKWLDPTVVNEYNSIIKIALSNPKNAMKFIGMNLADATVTMFGTNVSDGIRVFRSGSSPWNNIQTYYPSNLERFKSAKQQQDKWNFEVINIIMKFAFWGTCLLLFVRLLLISKNNKKYDILFITLLICFLNCLITTSLSTYLDRFNARVIWILPISMLLIILNNKKVIIKK